MKKFTLSKNIKHTLEISDTNVQWTIEDQVQIRSKSTGIWASNPDQHDVLITLHGDVVAGGNGITSQQGDRIAVYVGEKGSIAAGAWAVALSGIGAEVENHGRLEGVLGGVGLGPDGAFTNYGVVHGTQYGYGDILGDLRVQHVVNAKGGVVEGDHYGVELGYSTVILKNAGLIKGMDGSLQLSTGDDTVTNTGILKGAVELGGGDDTFANKGGTVRGAISGGEGNDTYTVDSSALKLKELSDEGSDTVRSSIDWTLGDNFEKLILTGKKTLDGIGNALANTITGNAQANVITGLGGNDMLTGGGGADSFVFAPGSGQDTIKDFVHGSDHIDVSAFGFTGLTDLVVVYDAKSTTITLAEGDMLVLKGVTSGIDAADFIFA